MTISFFTSVCLFDNPSSVLKSKQTPVPDFFFFEHKHSRSDPQVILCKNSPGVPVPGYSLADLGTQSQQKNSYSIQVFPQRAELSPGKLFQRRHISVQSQCKAVCTISPNKAFKFTQIPFQQESKGHQTQYVLWLLPIY